MRIEPTPVHRAPVRGPSAWVRADFPDPEVFTYRFDPATFSDRDAAAIRRQLLHGRGFVVLKGMPVDRLPEEELSELYWQLGGKFGRQLPQNVPGDRLYSVRDEGYHIGRDYGRVGVRFSKTTEGLQFHTDSAPALLGNTPDILGLFALQVARSGGESALVSAATLHNCLLAERPDYLERLYQPYHFDRSAEWREGEPRTLLAPIFRWPGRVNIRYFRFYIPKGHALAGAPLDEAPFDCLDSIANRPELQVTFSLQPGDIQLISNTFILHARTAFEDWPEPARKRHLKRLWILSV